MLRGYDYITKADFLESYRNLTPHSIDLFLSDPPYGIFENSQKLTGVDDPQINIDKLNSALDYHLTKNGTALIFCNLDLLYKLKEGLTDFDFRWEYVCHKNNGMPTGSTRPLHNIEYVGVWKRKDCRATDLSFNRFESGIIKEPYSKKNINLEHSTRNMTKRKHDTNSTGKRHIKQSLPMTAKCNLPKAERTDHPFQKPEKLLRTLIRVHSNENGMVMDGFAGSGSTIIAAHKENRRALGFEKDEKWFQTARERIYEFLEASYAG